MKTILSIGLVLFSLTACHTHKTSTPSTMTETSTSIPWVKDMIDPAQANAMGEAIEKILVAAYPLYQQNKVVTYVQEVGTNVAKFSARPHHPVYEFFVLDTKEWINMGLPGGRVFISRGVLQHIENESELAALLGTSVANITHQHLLQWLKDNQKLDLTQAVTPTDEVWEKAYQQLRVMGFDADVMNEADRSGISYAMHAGYDPAGLQHILQRLTTLLEENPSLKEQGLLGANALAHRSSIGPIHLEQAKVHENVFSPRKGHFQSIKKYL